jgi:hypothetical protein
VPRCAWSALGLGRRHAPAHFCHRVPRGAVRTWRLPPCRVHLRDVRVDSVRALEALTAPGAAVVARVLVDLGLTPVGVGRHAGKVVAVPRVATCAACCGDSWVYLWVDACGGGTQLASPIGGGLLTREAEKKASDGAVDDGPKLARPPPGSSVTQRQAP